jgi:hypothetical protein
MDKQKINLIGRWAIMGILACGGVACVFTGKAEYAVGFAVAAFWFWIITD